MNNVAYRHEYLSDEAFLCEYGHLKYSTDESGVCKDALRRLENLIYSKDELRSPQAQALLADKFIDDLDGLQEFLDKADDDAELLCDLCDLMSEELGKEVCFSELLDTVKDLIKAKQGAV